MSSPQKSYQYQIFSSAGVYLGLLQNVASDFNYNQQINTVGAQLQITVAQSADTASQALSFIADEFGNPITDELGDDLLIERQPDLIGGGNSNALINNNNLITVVEFSSYSPNGTVVFQGYISKWKAGFGTNENIIVTCLSNGGDLNNFLVLGAATADQNQLTQNSNGRVYNLGLGGGKGAGWALMGQTFTTGVGVTSISAITVYLAGNGIADTVATLNLWTSPNDYFTVPAQASASVTIPKNQTAQAVTFTFATPISVTANTQYFFTVDPNDANGFSIYYQNSDVYAGGSMWVNDYGGGSGGGVWYQTPIGALSASDLYFETFYTAGATNSPFTNQDPSTILTTIIQNYNSRGGLLQIPSGGYALTGVETTYTFKVQTILQAIQTLLAQSPANWYFYGDPATNSLIFAKASSTPDIVLVKGRHINDLDLEATKENIKNVAYFTGGDDGTGTSTNIFINETLPIAGNRVGLILLSDNRVSAALIGSEAAAQGVGRAIAVANLQENQAETYQATVTIQDTTMDINTVKLGKTIGFAGFGTFIDQLVLEVVGVNKSPDQVTAQIGTLPKRASKTLADIQTALAYLQTVNNPTTSS